MNDFNASRVRLGDRIQVAIYVNERWIKGHTAKVLNVYPEFVLVRWDGDCGTQSTIFHNEYEILPRPRTTISERIAFVLLILVVIFAFAARATGFYDN